MKTIVKVTPSMGFDILCNKLIRMDKELLLCFDLKEKDLNKKTGNKIIALLNNLSSKNIKFKVSRPLPRCLFSLDYSKILKKFNIPLDCYTCNELFVVEKDIIKSCTLINKKGPKKYYMSDRNQIAEFFNNLRLEKEACDTCKHCLYFIRRMCDGVCFRKS